MTSDLTYVKAYVCECGCAWTVEKQDPEICWACNSHGPHTVMATCRADPKLMSISSSYSEEILFSPVSEMDGQNELG